MATASAKLPESHDAVWREESVALSLIREAIDSNGSETVARDLMRDEYREVLCSYCMDLVPMLAQDTSCPQVARLLHCMVEVCSTKEMNVSLLELLDENRTVKELMELMPLFSEVVVKVWSSRVWKSTVSTAEAVIRQTQCTFLDSIESGPKAKKGAPKLTQGMTVYVDAMTDFMQALSSLVSTRDEDQKNRSEERLKLQELSIQGLLFLLGTPLSSHLTHTSPDDCEPVLTSCGKKSARIMDLLSSLKCKYHCLLEDELFHHQRYSKQQLNAQGRSVSLGTASVAYLWAGQGLQWSSYPSPLRLEYTTQLCFRSAIVLLTEYDKSDAYIVKGQTLLDRCVAMVSPECYEPDDLTNSCCLELLIALTKVAAYCQTESLRRKAVPLFHKVIKLYLPQARHKIYKCLFHQTENAGVWELLIQDLKNEVHLAIRDEQRKSDSPFLGRSLSTLLYVALSLPEFKDKTSVLEHSDRLMSAVNFLLYLMASNKGSSPQTAVIDDLNHWKTAFCQPLSKAIEFSKDKHQRHYEGLMTEEKSNPASSKATSYSDIAVEVAGELLPDIPDENSTEGLVQSLLQLQLMEHNLKRVAELVDEALQVQISSSSSSEAECVP